MFSLIGLVLGCSSPAPTTTPIGETPSPTAEASLPPALVVYIVVDQLPLSLFEPVRPFFQHGFKRLTGPDAFVSTARYAHAVTYTGPGHATLSTGASPNVHGIISNGWMVDEERVYCCANIDNLNAEPLSDRVRAAGGEVASISLKDRGAILLGGHDPSALVYFDKKAGAFVGPSWAQVDIASVLTEEWSHRLPEALQALYPDAQDHEPSDAWGNASFPHPALGPENAAHFPVHPKAGSVVTDLAITAVDALDLGKDARPDLLTVSYSQTDYVGHLFSPQSREALDALLVLDEDLGRLFAHLDTQVGTDRWTAVLTADHGAAPGTARRIDLKAFKTTAQAAFNDAGFEGDLTFIEPTLNLPNAITKDPKQRLVATTAIVDALRDYDGLAGAWAWRNDGGFPADLPYRDTYLASVDSVRSGDIFVMLAEGVLFTYDDDVTGSSHGTPYDYDTRVPFLAVGHHIRPGSPAESTDVDVRRIPATVGALLGVGAPAQGLQEPIRGALP
jgi:predicted AlkP superfamily pyrophosphatase or phosphodiesterase